MVDENRLGERYVLQSRISVGGMGGVYVATDERLERPVAVKVLKEELVDDPRFVERFRREARAVAALSHPNVAAVYDYGEDGGRHFIVMELVEGRDLARLLGEEGPLEPDRAARIAAAVARALEHAHAAGVVHRDIKPANIMLSPGDRVKVTDFGIARAMGDSSLTMTGSVMGTAQYISPEQAAGEAAGPHSDIYSLGIVLFEMVTGAAPFTGDSALAVAMKHVNERVPAPSTLNPDVPDSLDRIVTTATARDPSDRYPSAAAMAEEVGETAVTLEAGATAEIAPEELDRSVWPIPGARYDPEKLGRRVIGTFVALALVALALLVWRLASNDELAARGRAGGPPGVLPETDGATPSPETVTLESYIDLDYRDVERDLTDAGLAVGKEDVDSEAEKHTIIDQRPEPGTVVEAGDTVTLTVSTGHSPEGEEEPGPPDEGNGPPGDVPGRGNENGHGEEEDD